MLLGGGLAAGLAPARRLAAAEEGVVVERVLKEGAGDPPRPGDFVVVSYDVVLAATGAAVDSTRARNKPVAYVFGGRPFGGVTEGLQRAVGTLRPGGRATVRVPASLAFGAKGAVFEPVPLCTGVFCDKSVKDLPYVRVPPDADLVYDVELVKVVRDAPPTMRR